jgi:hypothetical protein
LHTQPVLQQTNLLTDGASSDVQLVRGLLKAEMAGRRLEGAQSIWHRHSAASFAPLVADASLQ